jgi:GntR family transcriptional regulator, transcriptional repressor for pyruvate dehydrogenase complex
MDEDDTPRKAETKARDLPIRPLQQRGHTDHMVSSIMSMIEQGILKEGDVLPPERELAQQFNVGRNTLREAIKVLEIYGVVDRAPRLGTVIRRANLDHIVGIAFAGMQITPEVFEDIQGYRSLIEMGIAPAVVERVTNEDLSRLDMLIDRMAATSDLSEQAQWDYAFHLALVSLAGNAVLARTYRVMAEPMKRLMELGKGSHGTQVAIDQHRDIVAALRARNIDAYTQMLAKHMKFGRQYVSAAQAGTLDPQQNSSGL